MEKISDNLYRGELITNPMHIMRLAEEKKSVYCHNVWGIRPAAILLNYPLFLIIKAIKEEKLFYTHK